MPGRITVVEYDPEWPMYYEKEKKLILEAISEYVITIDHIGSTSIPGLGAKPIIDILAGMDSQETADSCLEPLSRIGYDDVTPEPQEDDWYYCLGKGPHSPGVHLHFVKDGCDHWRKHILVRDYLRTHPEICREYYEMKLALVSRYADQREIYTESKSGFINRVVEKALRTIL
ncbi:MAG: GrpB family protein [Candidatus Bathyarchaeota archaeon]|nr:GrpB family protein [Candidatus Bathyarchaeota archaeon]